MKQQHLIAMGMVIVLVGAILIIDAEEGAVPGTIEIQTPDCPGNTLPAGDSLDGHCMLIGGKPSLEVEIRVPGQPDPILCPVDETGRFSTINIATSEGWVGKDIVIVASDKGGASVTRTIKLVR